MQTNNIKKCKELLGDYRKKYENSGLPTGEFLYFDIEGDIRRITAPFQDQVCLDSEMIAANITIYNPTKPIKHHGKKYLLGRVEPLSSEKSKVMFFEETNGKWKILPNTPVFNLQDPFHIENVQEYYILGGVNVHEDADVAGALIYETVFYRYKESVLELISPDGNLVEPFAKSPSMMKDVRLVELENGHIGVFTRPQGGEAGLGKIAYIEIENLEQLEELIPKAKIIPNQFNSDEWGGVNDAFLLKNGMIGVLGHIAHKNGNLKHYYAMAFVFDSSNHKTSPIEILTTADEFPPLKPKKEDLGKVIFSGGMNRHDNGKADLYVGVGDARAGKISINDPFVLYDCVP